VITTWGRPWPNTTRRAHQMGVLCKGAGGLVAASIGGRREGHSLDDSSSEQRALDPVNVPGAMGSQGSQLKRRSRHHLERRTITDCACTVRHGSSKVIFLKRPVVSRYQIAGHKILSEMSCVSRSCSRVNLKFCKGPAKSPSIFYSGNSLYSRVLFSSTYGACPKNETCAFSGRLTHHCTGAGGVGYEIILDWPPWKEPLPTRAWLKTP